MMMAMKMSPNIVYRLLRCAIIVAGLFDQTAAAAAGGAKNTTCGKLHRMSLSFARVHLEFGQLL